MSNASGIRAQEAEMTGILDTLLAADQNITARAVVRLHSSIKAASSITRNEIRSALLADYQTRQQEYRAWRDRTGKSTGGSTAEVLAKKDERIAQLESSVQILTSSHVALLRAVGAMGGFRQWALFFEKHQEVRHKLADLGAMPDSVTDMHEERDKRTLPSKTRKK